MTTSLYIDKGGLYLPTADLDVMKAQNPTDARITRYSFGKSQGIFFYKQRMLDEYKRTKEIQKYER